MKIWPLVFALVLSAGLVRRRRSLEPTLIAGGALVVAALVVYGTGVVKLPNLEHALVSVGESLGRWTYLLVGVLAFLETGAFVGLLAPGETALIVGGVVAGQGRISLVTVIGIAWACAVLGDCVSFELGRRKGRAFLLRHGPRFGMAEPRIVKVEAFFERHGGKAIFLGRFVGIVRAVAPFLAGSGRMPFRRFFPYDVLGAGLWTSTFLVLGYLFWQSLDTVLAIAKTGALGLGVAISVVVGVTLTVRRLRIEEHRRELERRFDAALDHPLLRPLAPLVRWLRGPARFLWNRLTPGDLGLELTTLLAVAAAGSFAFIGGWITAGQGELGPADRMVHRWTQDLSPGDALVEASKLLTQLGGTTVIAAVVLLGALALAARRRWSDATVLVAGTVIVHAFVHLAKADTDRPRPADALVPAGGSAFPSGHTAHAVAWVALAVVAMRAIPALRLRGVALITVAIGVVVVVAATRVLLRVHWLSDVVAGAGAGALGYAGVAVVLLVVTTLRQNGGRA